MKYVIASGFFLDQDKHPRFNWFGVFDTKEQAEDWLKEYEGENWWIGEMKEVV